jgi:CRISPR-associated endonuclease/helicase Cas3
VFTRLLAKSSADPNAPRAAETLPGHTELVLASVERLIKERGSQALQALGIPGSALARLTRLTMVAALLHDVGKASDHFQALVRALRTVPQLIRHEALALWISWPGRPLAEWLLTAVDDERDLLLALAAVAGHHRKFWAQAVAAADSGASTEVSLALSHPDFVEALRVGSVHLGLGAPPPLADIVIQSSRRSRPETYINTLADEWEERVAPDDETARLLAAVKSFLIAADVAGSALPRGGGSPDWISRSLAVGTQGRELLDVATLSLGDDKARPFQDATAASGAPVTLVRAGCGTGKTVAAYLWAARQHPERRLWVTYPTTGTATEGFRDYVFKAPVAGRLDHSRAAIDMEIFGVDDGAETARDFDRIEALRVWSASITVCTVDTVLGLLHNQRKGLYAWPSLAGGAVVFDEIHAYDERLFGTLLRFLEALPGIPALLMTASLPAKRLEALRALVARVHGRALAEIPGPVELERLPRYQRLTVEDPRAEALRALDLGQKVLWVSNTVERCRRVAEAVTEPSPAPLIYHSRFKYVDRVQRHGAVIDAFRGRGPALAVTTQVAEMSLDLSADLLLTDLATIPSLIQRLGRLNRYVQQGDPVRPFVVLPFEGPPYATADLERAEAWLDTLGRGPLSQADLSDAWRDTETSLPAPCECAWLDGGFRTEPMPVRDLEPSVTVLMQEDVPALRRGQRDCGEVALNMPPRRTADLSALPRIYGLPIVPPGLIDYDPLRGARWHV